MTEIIQYDNPNDITYMDSLKIEAVSRNSLLRIYANGNNQLPIEITAKAIGKGSKVLKFSKETWIHILNLCFAESDKKLSWQHRSGWCFTDAINDYSKEVGVVSARNISFGVRDDGAVRIIMYVYTDDIDIKRIAVRVDTDNDKHFTTADISTAVEQMSVTVNAIEQINYSNRVNLDIHSEEFITISSNLGWTSRFGFPHTYSEYNSGTCQRRVVKIYPVKSMTGQAKFKKHEIVYDGIKNNDVNYGTIDWGDKTEDCFDLMQTGAGYPCAVIGRGANYSDYQLNLWFSITNKININGQVYMESPDYYYRFCPYVQENHETDNNEGIPELLLYKFTMPDNADHQFHWNDVIRAVTVNVTDIYGNESAIKLSFNDSDSFDRPSIQ